MQMHPQTDREIFSWPYFAPLRHLSRLHAGTQDHLPSFWTKDRCKAFTVLFYHSSAKTVKAAGRGWSPGGQKDRPGRFPLVCPFGFRKDYPGLRTAAPRRERLHKPRAAPAMQRRPAADARTDLQTPADTGAGTASAGPPAPDPQRLKKTNPLKLLKFQGIFGTSQHYRCP